MKTPPRRAWTVAALRNVASRQVSDQAVRYAGNDIEYMVSHGPRFGTITGGKQARLGDLHGQSFGTPLETRVRRAAVPEGAIADML